MISRWSAARPDGFDQAFISVSLYDSVGGRNTELGRPMVHILAPHPKLGTMPIFFNVDGAVGANAPNADPADVMLV